MFFSPFFFLDESTYHQHPEPYQLQCYDDITKQQKYFCDNGCGRSYSSINNMKRHVKVECGTEEKKFQCQVCLKRFRRKFHLKRHFNTVHGYKSEKLKFYCVENV